ncbi:MAG: hypothetical protein ACOCXA_05595 [Planctomycetota bacterium]
MIDIITSICFGLFVAASAFLFTFGICNLVELMIADAVRDEFRKQDEERKRQVERQREHEQFVHDLRSIQNPD